MDFEKDRHVKQSVIDLSTENGDQYPSYICIFFSNHMYIYGIYNDVEVLFKKDS